MPTRRLNGKLPDTLRFCSGNGSNSQPGARRAIGAAAGRELPYIEADVRDGDAPDRAFGGHEADAVMHSAGAEAAGESVANPGYYDANNVAGTAVLLDRMAAHGVKRLVFGSSAAVYAAASSPLAEDDAKAPATPYGRTKSMAETMLADVCAADPDWRVSVPRYFNAAGGHPDGTLRDGLWGRCAHLIPRIGDVASGLRDCLEVHGGDDPTPDGTRVRDYLPVVDVAGAHVKALERLAAESGLSAHDLGSGVGAGVLDVVRAFERAHGRSIPVRMAERRPGDAAVCCADPSRARAELGWTARLDLERICRDAWRG